MDLSRPPGTEIFSCIRPFKEREAVEAAAQAGAAALRVEAASVHRIVPAGKLQDLRANVVGMVNDSFPMPINRLT